MKQLRTVLALFLAVFLAVQPAAGSASLLLLSASAEEDEEDRDPPVPKIDQSDESYNSGNGGGHGMPGSGSGGGDGNGGTTGGSNTDPEGTGGGTDTDGNDSSGSSGEDSTNNDGSSSGNGNDAGDRDEESGTSEKDNSGEDNTNNDGGSSGDKNDTGNSDEDSSASGEDSSGAEENGTEGSDESTRNPGASESRGDTGQFKNILNDVKNGDEVLGSLNNLRDGKAKGKNITSLAFALAGTRDTDSEAYSRTVSTLQNSLTARQYQQLVNEFGIQQNMKEKNYLTRQLALIGDNGLAKEFSEKLNVYEIEARSGRIHAGLFNGLLDKPVNMAGNGLKALTKGALNELDEHVEAAGMMVNNVSERLHKMADAGAAKTEQSLKYADAKREAARGNKWNNMKAVATEWTNKGLTETLTAASKGFSRMSQFGEAVENSNTGKAVGDMLKSGRQAVGNAWNSTANVINKAMDSEVGKKVRNLASSPVGKIAGGALSGLSLYDGYKKVTSGDGWQDTVSGYADIASGGLGLAAVAATTVFTGTAAAAAAPLLATGAAAAGIVSLGVMYGPKLVKGVSGLAKNSWNAAKNAVGNAASAAKDAAKNVGESIASGVSSIFGGSS
ncbi:hypothetical protein [Salibacterium halotolerans]|uniref:Uncharacterized protein n=1 Tax=Salibacterium halotolerans TaxID=1884432 RepID=A0A1I5TRK9_9BACI|nr:hypothetical protein [Salibacterium halotolerans]SFP85541.1 hypothetical protein SAMN05518683_11159 [Salibacterium halotolerans]